MIANLNPGVPLIADADTGYGGMLPSNIAVKPGADRQLQALS
jgi:hypothetical protein